MKKRVLFLGMAMLVVTILILVGCDYQTTEPTSYGIASPDSPADPPSPPPEPGSESRTTMGIDGSDNLNALYPDIHDTANVYGMGTMFEEWNGSFGSKVYLCEWSEIGNLTIDRLVCIGYEYTVALYVDGRMITEEISICDSLLWHTEFDGNQSPWAYIWNTFSLHLDPEMENVYVYRGEDNRSMMASCRFVYDGWSETCPSSGLNGPAASPNYPAFLESNLSYGQRTPMYWQQAEGAYAKWYRVLTSSEVDSGRYNVAFSVDGQSPYLRIWGAYVGSQELWHLYQVLPPPDAWYVFRFGVNPDGTINQGEDNRVASTNSAPFPDDPRVIDYEQFRQSNN